MFQQWMNCGKFTFFFFEKKTKCRQRHLIWNRKNYANSKWHLQKISAHPTNKTNDREKTGELMKFIFCLTLFQGHISLSSPYQFGFVRCTKYSRFFLLFLRHLLSILFPICDFPFFVYCETVDGCLNFTQFFDIDGNSQVLVIFLQFFSRHTVVQWMMKSTTQTRSERNDADSCYCCLHNNFGFYLILSKFLFIYR